MSFVLGSGAIILDKIYLGQRRLRLYYGVGGFFFCVHCRHSWEFGGYYILSGRSVEGMVSIILYYTIVCTCIVNPVKTMVRRN